MIRLSCAKIPSRPLPTTRMHASELSTTLDSERCADVTAKITEGPICPGRPKDAWEARRNCTGRIHRLFVDGRIEGRGIPRLVRLEAARGRWPLLNCGSLL